MYNLYASKYKRILKIQKVGKTHAKLSTDYTEEVKQFNPLYYVCTNRGNLKQFALELHAQWIEEARQDLDEIVAIKM